jgi:thioesterase domain-containing protein
MPDRAKLEAYLHDAIPISAAMGVRVAEASDERVRLVAPLGPNLNHKRTVFGGSLYSTALLAGWSWTYLCLGREALAAEIVIASSRSRYQRPALAEFEATCDAPADAAVLRFVETVKRKGLAQLELPITVTCGGATVALIDGVYGAVAPGRRGKHP